MNITTFFSFPSLIQDGSQIGNLALAFALSSLIGLERESKMRSAGLRTHALVGLSAALLMTVSKYGFMDVLDLDHVALDPSRVAAQIVSGIGFIGGGLIFVRKDIVHGLTTAAAVWLTAGIGMACGGGLHTLALAATAGHFIVAFGYTPVLARILGRTSRLHVRYRLGHDVAARVLDICAERDFTLLGFTLRTEKEEPDTARMEARVQGRAAVLPLVDALTRLPAVISVTVNPPENDE